MDLQPIPCVPNLLIAATAQLNEKPRLGFESWKSALHPGIGPCKSTAELGLPASLAWNAVRQVEHDGSYDLTNPQSLNRYAYALNNPLGFIDPTGQDCYTVGGDTWTIDSGDGTVTTGSDPGTTVCTDPGSWPCQEYGYCGSNTSSNSSVPPTQATAPSNPAKPGCQYGTMNLSNNNLVAKFLSAGFWSGLLTGNYLLTAGAAADYVNLVRTGGDWDPKDGPGGPTPANIDAGNVNFGATCSQFGLHTQIGGEICQYGAGFYGHNFGTQPTKDIPYSTDHGDQQQDSQQIQQGLAKGDC